MDTYKELNKHRLFKRFTLSFQDPGLESLFLDEYNKNTLRVLLSLLLWTAITVFLVLGGILVLFSHLTQVRYLLFFLLGLWGSAIIIFGLLALLLPSSVHVMQLNLFINQVLLGCGYVYSLSILQGSNLQAYVFVIIAGHMVAVSLATPLRFFYGILALHTIWVGFGFMAFVLSDLGIVDAILQSLFLGVFTIFCSFASYQRETATRVTFYQRHVIEKRERELANEQKKSEALLLNILPASIAERLKKHPHTIADAFDETSILFADIVGFTILSERIPPEELVTILNELFSMFDDLTEKHGLEKIKTIGDAYMVVAGLPKRRHDHAEAIAAMALDMRQAMAEYNTTSDNSLQIRIGIHSGPVVAGVIGKKKFAYDLWGDAVNTAARMESHGIPGEIQVTQATYELLKDKFAFEERGSIDVKGKGPMQVYLLRGDRE
jgi:class 3 adenylate cyclase